MRECRGARSTRTATDGGECTRAWPPLLLEGAYSRRTCGNKNDCLHRSIPSDPTPPPPPPITSFSPHRLVIAFVTGVVNDGALTRLHRRGTKRRERRAPATRRAGTLALGSVRDTTTVCELKVVGTSSPAGTGGLHVCILWLGQLAVEIMVG